LYYFSIGQRLITKSTAIVMLNHFSRTGCDSQSRSSAPKCGPPSQAPPAAMPAA
jgi:hypothetical protein